ncbi:MAG TPA: rRNA adenine N-6-methyltransferase family protein [Streptosporangiaceae bacterium]
MAGRALLAPNPAGAHFLRDRTLISLLASASGARDGRLVFDLGAGAGAITARLAATGARVIAVERDPRFAARLRRRFDGEPRVRVVEADIRTVALPRRPFLVVASPPFALTTLLFRRLLGDPLVPLAGAELIVQREAARSLARSRPRGAETAWWAARYEIRLTQAVSAASFVPAPSVSAAWLSIRPRPALAQARGQGQFRTLLRTAYHRPGARTGHALAGHHRLLVRAGISPAVPVCEVTADQWHQLAVQLAGAHGFR